MRFKLRSERFKAMSAVWGRFLNDEMGQDLIEYALVACLVGLGAVATIRQVGVRVADVFTGIGTSLTSSI